MNDWLQYLTAAATAISAFVGLMNRMAVAEMKQEILRVKLELMEAKAQDKEELKQWMNGSFMRSKEVERMWAHHEGWLSGHEKRIDALEER